MKTTLEVLKKLGDFDVARLALVVAGTAILTVWLVVWALVHMADKLHS